MALPLGRFVRLARRRPPHVARLPSRSAKRRVDRRLPAAPLAALRRLHRDAAGPRGLGAEDLPAHRLGGGIHDTAPLPRTAALFAASAVTPPPTPLTLPTV